MVIRRKKTHQTKNGSFEGGDENVESENCYTSHRQTMNRRNLRDQTPYHLAVKTKVTRNVSCNYCVTIGRPILITFEGVR